jgi:chromate reductase
MAKLKLGVIVGSSQRKSINRNPAQALVRLGADAFDATFVQIDDLPMYNQDHEQPVPDKVARFKSEIGPSDVVTPEHSRSIPPVFKNAIDWCARLWGKTSWPGKSPPSSALQAAPSPRPWLAPRSTVGAMHVMGGEA